MNVNKCILVGRLGKDPELKDSLGGPFARLSVATTGIDRKRTTTWHRVVAFGQSATFISQYAHKGDVVYIEGELRNADYTDKNGVKHYGMDIIANRVNLLSEKDRQAKGGATVTPTESFDPGFDQPVGDSPF